MKKYWYYVQVSLIAAIPIFVIGFFLGKNHLAERQPELLETFVVFSSCATFYLWYFQALSRSKWGTCSKGEDHPSSSAIE